MTIYESLACPERLHGVRCEKRMGKRKHLTHAYARPADPYSPVVVTWTAAKVSAV